MLAVEQTLFGARTVAQVQENVGALSVVPRLTDDVMEALRAL